MLVTYQHCVPTLVMLVDQMKRMIPQFPRAVVPMKYDNIF
jgi:hypothetical protein